MRLSEEGVHSYALATRGLWSFLESLLLACEASHVLSLMRFRGGDKAGTARCLACESMDSWMCVWDAVLGDSELLVFFFFCLLKLARHWLLNLSTFWKDFLSLFEFCILSEDSVKFVMAFITWGFALLRAYVLQCCTFFAFRHLLEMLSSAW